MVCVLSGEKEMEQLKNILSVIIIIVIGGGVIAMLCYLPSWALGQLLVIVPLSAVLSFSFTWAIFRLARKW